MVRVLVETSLPLHTVEKVREALRPEALGVEVFAGLQLRESCAGCGTPATGGKARWTPCTISLETYALGPSLLAPALAAVKAAVTQACREGGMEIFCLPAAARIGDRFLRFRDLDDVARQDERD